MQHVVKNSYLKFIKRCYYALPHVRVEGTNMRSSSYLPRSMEYMYIHMYVYMWILYSASCIM